MNILFACSAAPIGGAEIQLKTLASQVMARSHTIHLLLHQNDAVPEFESFLTSAGLPVDRIQTPAFQTASSFERYLPQATSYLKKLSCDLIHIHVPYFQVPHLYIAHAAEPLGIPTVINFQCVSPYESRCDNPPWLMRFYRSARALVFVSENNRKLFFTMFPSVPAGRSRLIPNGVDTARMRHRSPEGVKRIREELQAEGKNVIVTVARLAPGKGHIDLLLAAERILREHERVLFVFVGDGPLWESLTDWVRGHGLEEHIRFLGFRHDIPEILGASDIFAFPSHFEGFSLALAEAMAAGMPVVSARVGGAEDMIRDGVSGLLVDPHAPDQLYSALKRLLDDPTVRQSYARAAHAASAAFDTHTMTDRYLDLYRSMINSSGRELPDGPADARGRADH